MCRINDIRILLYEVLHWVMATNPAFDYIETNVTITT